MSMFTGIVQGMGAVRAIHPRERATSLQIDLGSLVAGVSLGASVAIAGTCLTVVAVDGACTIFDVIGETLDKTTLGSLKVGDLVNIERSARIGDEIGGHILSGHVSGVVEIYACNIAENNHVLKLRCDPVWMPYLLPKGFVALDGCSLTVADVYSDDFTVHLIPETLARTTFGFKKTGDHLHLEIDAMTRATVDTVTRFLERRATPTTA